MDNSIPNRKPDLLLVNKNKRTCPQVDFDILADHRVKGKESKKLDKHQDFARGMKKFWHINVILIPIISGVLETVSKKLEKSLLLKLKHKILEVQIPQNQAPHQC